MRVEPQSDWQASSVNRTPSPSSGRSIAANERRLGGGQRGARSALNGSRRCASRGHSEFSVSAMVGFLPRCFFTALSASRAAPRTMMSSAETPSAIAIAARGSAPSGTHASADRRDLSRYSTAPKPSGGPRFRISEANCPAFQFLTAFASRQRSEYNAASGSGDSGKAICWVEQRENA
jgi:hypothetical protein